MKKYSRTKIIAIITLLLSFYNGAAYAQCVTPEGVAGNQIYNSRYKIMQFCDGTNWIAMGAKITEALWMENGSTKNIYYNSGNVGIGTDTPTTALHVMGMITAGGGIRLADQSVVSNCTVSGDLRYNSTDKKLEVCDGSAWQISSGGKMTAEGMVAFAGSNLFLTGGSNNFIWNNGRNVLEVSAIDVADKILFAGVPGNAPIGETPATLDFNIEDLLNVTVSAASNGQQLLFNGSEWVNSNPAWFIGSGNVYRASGNVGIGTNAPDTPLHVVGGVKLADFTTAGIVTNSALGVLGTVSAIPVENGGTGITAMPATGGVIFSDGSKLASDSANLFWDDTQNRLGVGTSSPQAQFNVRYPGTIGGTSANISQAAILVSPTADVNQGVLAIDANEINHFNSGAAVPLSIVGENGITLNVGDGADSSSKGAITILSNSNVGVGPSAPAAKLHVRQTAATGSEQVARFDVSDDANSYLRISNGTAADSAFVPMIEGRPYGNIPFYIQANALAGNDAGTNPLMAFTSSINGANVATRPLYQWQQGTGTPVMTMLANGNLGVGVANPSVKLEVESNSAIRIGAGYISSGGNQLEISSNSYFNGSSWVGTGNGSTIELHGNGAITFWTHNAAGVHTIMGGFTSNGLGSGTYSPAFGIDARGSAGWVGSGDNSQYIGGWRLGRWPDYAASTWVYLSRADSSAYANLAIGDLHAAGALRFSSDVRLKKDIVTLDHSLDKVLQMRGVKFKWKDETRGKDTYIGFIAQEMEKVIPELVAEGADKYKSISYANMTPVLVEAIKELVAKFNAKDDEMQALKQQVEILQQQVQELQAAKGHGE